MSILSLPSKAIRETSLLWSTDGRRLWLRSALFDAATGRAVYDSGAADRRVLPDPEMRHGLLTTAFEKRTTLIELPGGESYQFLAPWFDATTAAAWTRDGRGLALGSALGRVYVCRITPHGEGARSTRLPAGSSLQWNPAHDEFLVFGASQNVSIGRLPPASPLRPLGPAAQRSFPLLSALSPDGKRVAVALLDDTIQIWDTAAGQCIQRMTAHRRDPTFADQSPQFSRLVWGPRSARLASSRTDGTLQVWDAHTGAEVFGVDYGGFPNYVPNIFAWSPDEVQLAIIDGDSRDSGIAIWDLRTGKAQHKITGRYDVLNSALAWSPDGKTLAAYGGSPGGFILYDPVTGKERTGVSCPGVSSPALGWSPDSRRIAWSGGIYDSQTGQTTSLEKYDYAGSLTQIVWNPNGKELAVTNGVQAVIYDATSGKKSSAPDKLPRMSLCWTDQGLSGVRIESGNDGSAPALAIIVTNAATGKTVRLSEGEVGEVFRPQNQVAWAPNGERIAIAGWLRDNPRQGRCAFAIFDLATAREVRVLPLSAPTRKLSWTANGHIEVETDKGLEVWNAESGKMERVLPFEGSRKYLDNWWNVLSPDGKHYAAWERRGSTATCKVWDTLTNDLKYEFGGEEMASNPVPWQIVAWSPDGKYLAALCNQVSVWDVATGKEISRLMGHDGAIEALFWTADGARLVTRSKRKVALPKDVDWELKVWDPIHGEEIISLRGPLAGFEFTPDLRVFSQKVGNQLVLWDVSPSRKEKSAR